MRRIFADRMREPLFRGCGFAAPGSSARRRVYHLRRERLALQEFHDEKADSVLAADAIECADVG